MMDPGGRARLNVEAFIAAMLERVPLPALGRLVEGIACDTAAGVRMTTVNTAWHHDGVEAFIAELAERLMPAAGVSHEPAKAAVMWESAEGASIAEIAAVNDKLAAIARGAGASASLTSRDLSVLSVVLDEAARRRRVAGRALEAEAMLEDVEVWAHSSGTFPGEMLSDLRRYLGPERCGACRGGPPCLVHREGAAR